MNKFIALKDNLERIFLSDKKLVKTKHIYCNGKDIFIEKYEGFYSVVVLGIVRLFYISNNSEIKKHDDFIDVSFNNMYKLKNILKGSLIRTNIIIEGADGTGKSTLINELAQQGYLCQDRAVHEITQSMRENISKEKRLKNVKKYLAEKPDRKLVILYLSNEEKLKRRIFSREVISEYDKKALIFQRLYLDTFYSLYYFDNIFLIDVLNKTPKQLAIEVIKLI